LRERARKRFGRTDQQRHQQGVRHQVGTDEAAARQDPGSAADTGLPTTASADGIVNRRNA
jgi:hypothetical protein